MADISADRVRDTSTSTGTGALTVSGTAPTGHRTFSAVCAVGDTLRILIHNQTTPTEWEVCKATYSAPNQLTRGAPESSSNGGAAVSFSAGTKDVVHIVSALEMSWPRERLTANRDYYVGFVIGAPTISIASPAVASLTNHGLVAGDRVVFDVLLNKRAVTLSVASPCVASLTTHGLAAGQPIIFSSTGFLPAGVVAGTTYYVISTGLTANTFQFSATVGGAAINSSALANTFVNGNSTVTTSANHNLAVGQVIQFAGTSVVNVANATNYYVRSVTANTFTFATSGDGTAIVPGAVTTQGTVAQNGSHYCECAGALPTGVTRGTKYYVISTGLTANAFQFSTTAGGAAVNTSGTITGSPVYSAYTGNDANDGLSYSKAGAKLTLQNAFDQVVQTLDQAGFNVYLHLSYGTFTDGLYGAGQVSGDIHVFGANGNMPSNSIIAPASGTRCVQNGSPGGNCLLGIYDLRPEVTGGAEALFSSSPGSATIFGNLDFGPCGTGKHIAFSGGAQIYCDPGATYMISGGGNCHVYILNRSYAEFVVPNIKLTGVPAFDFYTYVQNQSLHSCYVPAFDGGAASNVGRFAVGQQSQIAAFGGGANVFPGTVPGTVDSSTFGLYT